MKGLIFSVKRYSIHDGPGIRVTFFMKGCPLGCVWCHNPEGIFPGQEIFNITNRVGEQEFFNCEEVGRFFTVEEVIEILEKEKVFFNNSNGGVTFSGGEPMFQFEFLHEALKTCKEKGYHTVVDTSGYSSYSNYLSVIPFTDLFLFDIKHMDNERHIEHTSVSNAIILDNYKLLLQNAKEVVLRIPVIPGFNDDISHLKRLREFIINTKTVSLKKINLLPLNKIGSSKYKKLNISYRMENVEPPDSQQMNELKDFFSDTGVKIKIGG